MQSKWDLLALIAIGCVLVTSALVKTDEAHAEPLRVTLTKPFFRLQGKVMPRWPVLSSRVFR